MRRYDQLHLHLWLVGLVVSGYSLKDKHEAKERIECHEDKLSCEGYYLCLAI